jgi:hypothetical protein
MIIRCCLIAAFSAALAALSFNPVRAATEADIQFVCQSHASAKIRAAFTAEHPEFAAIHCPADPPKPAAAATPPAQPTQTSSTKPKPLPAPGSITANPIYLLRSDWTDTGLLGAGCMTAPGSGVSADKAKGASLSFTRDYANDNRNWQAQAMAAVGYTQCTHLRISSNGDSGFLEKTIAVYAQTNSNYNSNAALAKKNNADTRTAGLSGEVAYLRSDGDIDVLRVTPNVVFNNLTNTTNAAVMVQYVPYWISTPGVWTQVGLPGNFANFQFNPTLDFQYANAMEQSKPLLFSGKNQSLRIGPELTFIIMPVGTKDDFWSNIGFSETFHPWYETYNGRGSYWWDNSIFYNLTQNFSVKLAYQRGLDENSGVMTNQYILSLAGKI